MTDEPEIAKASQREPCHETCRRLLHRPALQAPGQKHGVNIGEARMPCCTKMLARFFIGMGRRFPNSTTTRRGGTKPPTAAAQRRCSWPVPLPPFPCLWAAWFTDLLVFVCSRQRRVAALARGPGPRRVCAFRAFHRGFLSGAEALLHVPASGGRALRLWASCGPLRSFERTRRKKIRENASRPQTRSLPLFFFS
uniref:TcC31.15 n=1 Tax=Trypanosoma cruzi TaxID=5693 RepID=Q8I731_TRYCR|nr:TcC31.15 [Trypanosoma cruzi]